MLIQIYHCINCGSVLIENLNSRRSNAYEPGCPFCDEGEDRNITKLEPEGNQDAIVDRALENLMSVLNSTFGIDFND